MNEKRIKIVLLTDCLVDYAGGAEKQIYALAQRLDKKKFEVIVVSLDCEGKASPEVINSLGCRLVVFRVVRIYGISGLRQGLRFLKFLKSEKIDILQTYHFSSDIWGAFWGHLVKVKTIISNRRDMGFWRGWPHIQTYRLINRWVDRIVVVSESVKQMIMATEKIPAEKIQVIYNGIEIPKTIETISNSEAIKKELNIKSQEIVLVYVATLKEVKGHMFLLEAMSELIQQYTSMKLLLIGEDRMNGALQERTKQLGLDSHVNFLGKRTDTLRILSVADITLLPSLSEGLSNALLEYMTAAKPVIATSVGGNPEVVQNNYTGFLVPPQNAQAIKEALLKLLTDPEKRRVFGSNGFKRAETNFSLQKMVDTYSDLFTESVDANRPLRVLHLISSIGLFGAERVILNLVQYKEGVNATIGALHNHHNPHLEIVDEAKKLGLKTVMFDSFGAFDLRTISRVANFLKQNKIDIIHTHNYKSDLIGFCAARLAKTKWFATNHVWHSTDSKMAFYEKLDAAVLRWATRVIAVSDEIKQDLLKKKVERVTVIHNGIDILKFAPHQFNGQFRQRLGIASENIVVSIVGRLSKEKGHTIFLLAAENLVKKYPQVKFLVVGDGPLKETLTAEISQRHLNQRVILAGIQNNMAEVYAASDVLVNASFIEGLPMTILEAMASRLPIIATRVGATPQVLRHEVSGLLFNPGDEQALAQFISYLIDHPEKRRYLGQQAFEEVCRNFSMETMAKNYKEAYLCEGKG